MEPVEVGYDMDGVLATGRFKPGVPFVVITGRLENEMEATRAELSRLGLFPLHVFHRTEGRYGDGKLAGEHKAATVKRLRLKVFYEDNPDHVAAIRESCPECVVILVH